MFATPLQAALISYEGFEYTANASLNGRTGGTGWQSGWSGANNVMITTPGGTFPGLAATGNSVLALGNLPLIRPFTTTGFTTLRTAGRFGLDGTELWLSFLARRETNFTSADYGGVSLLDGGAQELFIGCTSGGSHWSLQLFDLGAAPGNITAATNAPIATGETTLLVLRFRFGVNGTQDHVELFVNPTPGLTPTTPDAARTGADIRFDRLRVQSGVNATSAMRFDEIRFGESFADVVPSTPGPAVAWLRTASQRVTAGAEITVPLFYAVPDGNPATLALAVTATDAGLLPPDRIVVSGTGGNRRVTFRPPSGVGGTSAITATVTPPGGVAVSATFDLIVRATPEGLLAYEPFDYTAGQSLLSRSGGEGFASAWTTGVPGAPSTSFQVGTSNLPYAGLAHVGTRTRAAAGAAQGLLRVPVLPLGEDGTVRYVSFLVRPDAALTPTGYFGLLLLGGVSGDLFVGKPGGGSPLKYVLENGGGTLQFPSAKAVTLNEVTFIVVKLEFRSGTDRVSLFVNPVPGSPEPLVADAVKEDLDLGIALAPALIGNVSWSADELRLGTTFASVTPIGASFALKPINTVAAREHSLLTFRIETVAPLSAGRTLSFEWVGESFGATLNAATGEVRWIPGELDGGQLRQFTVRATGNASPTDSDQVSFNVQVTEVNVPPQLEAIGSLLVEEGKLFSRQLTATDADLPSQPLSFTLVAGPDGFAVSSKGLLTWTPTVQQLDDLFPVTVSVFDTFQGTAESSFNVVTRSSSGGGEAVPPPPLFALATDTDVVLAWENRVGTFVLQSAPFLEGAPWLDVAVTPSLADGQNRVARPLTSAAGFFRLVSRGSTARLTGVTPRPGPLAPGLNQFVELTVTGGLGAGDLLEIVEDGSGLHNERRIPAEFLRQPDGSVGFFLDGDTLPIGTPQVSARLVNSAGAGRGVVSFEATNRPADTGGQPPAITGATWGGVEGAARRPFNDLVTLRPPLAISLTDSDADLARLEIRFTRPDGTTEGQIIPLNEAGPGPVSLTLFPLRFNRASPVGIWTAEVTAFDRAGHSSGSQTMQLIFGDSVPPGAVQPLALQYFQPLSGVPGDVVEVFVNGLADAGPTNARVRIGGRIATIIEATAELLRVVVPTDTAGGPVDVTTPQGSATAQAKFIVLPAPNVEPARAHALANQAIQFHLDRRLSASAVIAWSVTGGGSIGADGLFRAPGNLAEATDITVTATVSLPGTNVVATALVSVEAAPIARRAALVTAAAGGVVWSDDLLARVELPPGALAADSTVSIRVLAPAERPAPPANAQLLGAVELGPDGTQFTAPVRVRVPLTRSLAPGETLSLLRRNTAGGVWLDEGVVATVEPDGQSARAAVSHFSLYGLFARKTAASPSAGARVASPGIGIPCPGGTPPQITRVTPTSFYEGELQPIFIEGTGLDGDVELNLVHADGTDMPGIVLGPLVRARLSLLAVDGTRAAFLLNCPVLHTLGEGQDLPLRIRLRKCGSPDAFFPLLLHGLPEFTPADLAGARPEDHTFSRLYSEIVITSDLHLRFDVTDLRATHRIQVSGKVDASGRAAQGATNRINGVAEIPRRFRSGGQGGNQVPGDAEFVAQYYFPARQMRVGHRGAFGADLDSFVRLLPVAGCLGSNAVTCFDAIIANLHDDPFAELGDAPGELLGLLEQLPDGRRGASGLWNGAPAHWSRIAGAAISDNVNWARMFGAGSGGGGGGMSGAFHGDPGSRLGGGAGAEGGGAVRLVSARSLELSSLVIADGGPGGSGEEGQIAFAIPNGGNGNDSRIFAIINGGGGGGGGAGAVRLLAGESVLIRTNAGGRIQVLGGPAGLGGIATRPENIGFGLIAEVPYTEDAPPPEGMNVLEGALFDETLLTNSVVTLGVLTLEPKRPPEFFSYDGRPGLSLDPNRPHIVVYRVGTTLSRKCYYYLTGDPLHPTFSINLVLYPGLNTLELGGSGESLLNRNIVFLSGPDTDGDGLSDADEIALGTNPALADTDGDTLSDADELANGSDPRRADTDGDLLPDNVEIAMGTLPTNPDSDYDGLSDSLEVYRGQSPTNGNSAAFSYEEGELFAIVENEAGEKLLALLNPSTGKLGALGKVPGNRGDGITFDANGTLYLAQGDELFEWAGSVPYARAGLTPRTGPFIAVGSPGSSGSTGVIGMSPGVIPPPVTAGPGNVIADFRTVIDEDGQDALFKVIKSLRLKGMIDFAGQPSRSFPCSRDG